MSYSFNAPPSPPKRLHAQVTVSREGTSVNMREPTEAKVDEPTLVSAVHELLDEIKNLSYSTTSAHEAYFGGAVAEAKALDTKSYSPVRTLIDDLQRARMELRAVKGNMDDMLKAVGL